MSADKKVGISSVIPAIRGVRYLINKKTPITAMGQALKKTCLKTMNDRLLPNYERNIICATATVLDPRYKHHALTQPTMLTAVMNAVKAKLRTMPNQVVDRPLVQMYTEDIDSDDNLYADVDHKHRQLSSLGEEMDTGIAAFNSFSSAKTIDRSMCPVKFWRETKSHKLYSVAIDALLPMANSVPSERIASKINYYVGDLKTRITDDNLCKRIFLFSLPKDIIDALDFNSFKD